MDCTMSGHPVHHQILDFTQTHVHWVSDTIKPSHPLSSLLLLPSIFPSTRVFSNESVLCISWPKYWSFSISVSADFQHQSFQWTPRIDVFRMDWLDLLAIQRTLKSLLQYHSSKASILLCTAFFIVQLSHPSMTTEKTIALTRWTFVGKVMSLLFNGFPGRSDDKKKHLPTMREARVQSMGGEDPWRRKWQPTPEFLPGESYGQRSLVGYSPWASKESDTTEWAT